MAKCAPGHSRNTAWARTWAVECRSTALPASEPAVSTATSSPSFSTVNRSTSAPSMVAATAALASRGPMDLANSRAVGPAPLVPIVQHRDQIHLGAVGGGSPGRLGQPRADGLGELEGGRPLREL